MWIGKRKHFAGSDCKGKRYSTWLKGVVLRGIYPLVGLFALLWFLIRVIPKPSRASYPCQRAAFPIASSFVIYLTSLLGMSVVFHKANQHIRRARYWLAIVCVGIGFVIMFLTISCDSEVVIGGEAISNVPIGQAIGINPGRVVWVHDPNATFWDTSWNSQTDFFYWDPNHTNAEAIDRMLPKALCALTGQPNCVQAWDSIFKYYNRMHGKGDRGYQTGEKIIIKVNHNNQESYSGYSNQRADTPPSVYVSLLKQLVYDAKIAENCISLVDSIRYIDNKTYEACSAVFPNVKYVDIKGQAGRISSTIIPDIIHWSGINEATGEPIVSYPLNTSHFEADYIINLARLQGHNFVGVSFTAKNWYGSFGVSPAYDRTFHPGNVALHDMVRSPYRESSGYQILVDLMGHQQLGGKTVLYILDSLWGFVKNGNVSPAPYQYSPFNNDYPSSLFLSQDPVAIDSVAFDFYIAQYPYYQDMQYLHEAALANDPPSGTFYDPEGDGSRLTSLGVHEHWNNKVDKKYSRNLGTEQGIELIYISPQSDGYYLLCDFNSDGIVNEVDLKLLSDYWLTQEGDENWDSRFDIAPLGGDGSINILDFYMLSQNWMNTNCGAYFASDFNRDCRVNWNDLILLAATWLTEPELPGWDSRCDVMPAGGDGKIDIQDFAVLSEGWMQAYCHESFAGDFNQNCHVGMDDLIMLATAWLSEPGQPEWNERCDIQPAGGDQKIDFHDFVGLSSDWLKEQQRQ